MLTFPAVAIEIYIFGVKCYEHVANISHEFRTPLNMILGLIDTLLEVPEAYGESPPPLLMQVLEIVQRNSNHLTSMINDVLDLSQAEAGRMTLRREWADLADDIKNAVVMVVRPLIEKKALTFQVIIDDDFLIDRYYGMNMSLNQMATTIFAAPNKPPRRRPPRPDRSGRWRRWPQKANRGWPNWSWSPHLRSRPA